MSQIERMQITVNGAVQGVGFRPFIYRTALNLDLRGYVNNTPQGVFIEVEGARTELDQFLQTMQENKPAAAWIQQIDASYASAVGYSDFEIRHSAANGSKTALVLPDLAICPDCLRDILDTANRRYHYPFTNCTNCGPRYTIIEALPYDRPNTSMKHFAMCPDCRAEYENPLDRRFHAQPNACPTCGPHLELWTSDGEVMFTHGDALLAAAEAIRAGQIVAVKGLGGFHLVVDARNGDAIQTLRQHKHRPDKPFALMIPSLDMAQIYCEVSEVEASLLTSAQAPIVLLQHRDMARHTPTDTIDDSVAPGNPYLGVMLPYTPLHVLLMQELGFPIVATSGNLSDEPICTDEHEALKRLHGTADLFLVHNRPIIRPVDDSIVRVVGGREMILRRARGYAPLPVNAGGIDIPPGVLAAGAHQKNTVAISIGRNVFGSQHIGDLSTRQTLDAYQQTIDSLTTLYEPDVEQVACDLHPDYASTHYAESAGQPVTHVQHHEAHVLSCMLDHQLAPPVLGISWDGTGYGLDGMIWGGEFLHVTEIACERAACLRPFPLPGGDAAVKEPRRSALGLLYALYGDDVFDDAGTHDRAPLPTDDAFTSAERRVLKMMLQKQINTPVTSSMGRLFDAVAALLGLCQTTSFEGHAAMLLEFAAGESPLIPQPLLPQGEKGRNPTSTNGAHGGVSLRIDDVYDFDLVSQSDGAAMVDWSPMVTRILDDLRHGVPVERIAARFHHTLAEIIVAAAKEVGEQRVLLTGGCFQNVYLSECTIRRLREVGFEPYWHHHIPPNDGGIAYGQVAAAWREYALMRRHRDAEVNGSI